MDLTIGIVFCDKDVCFFNTLINNIKENIPDCFEYEIIIFDNTENRSLPENPYKVLTEGKNVYQFIGRKRIIAEARGRYTWFIDGDDSILKVPENFKTFNEDIIAFNAAEKFNGKILNYSILSYYKPFYVPKFNIDVIYTYLGAMLWNKWLKTDTLKSFLDKLPDIELVSGEDTTILVGVLFRSKIIRYENIGIYVHNTSASYSSIKNNLHRPQSEIDHLSIGTGSLPQLIEAVTNKAWLQQTGFIRIPEYNKNFINF